MPTPAFDYDYTYFKPHDCLRVLRNSEPTEYWRVEGDYILANTDELFVEYIRRVEDPSDWDPLFLEAFVARMAAELAMALTEDPKKQQSNMELYALKMREARLADGQEGKPLEIDTPALTEVRF